MLSPFSVSLKKIRNINAPSKSIKIINSISGIYFDYLRMIYASFMPNKTPEKLRFSGVFGFKSFQNETGIPF